MGASTALRRQFQRYERTMVRIASRLEARQPPTPEGERIVGGQAG